MLRHILVGVDGSESSKDAVALAGWLAKAWDAHLDAVHIVDTVYLKYDLLADIAGSMGFEPFGNFASREEEILNDLGDLILESFRTTCEDAGVTCNTLKLRGSTGTMLVEESRKSDMVIVGRKGVNAKYHPDRMGTTVEYLLRRTPRPMIIVPTGTDIPQTLILAFDDSAPSYRAAALAGEFSVKLKLPFHCIHVNDDHEKGLIKLGNLREYLQSEELEYSEQLVSGVDEDEIAEFTKSFPSPLLFVGLKGHSLLKDLLLGSTAEYLINRSDTPICCTM